MYCDGKYYVFESSSQRANFNFIFNYKLLAERLAAKYGNRKVLMAYSRICLN